MPFPKCQQAFFFEDGANSMQRAMVFRIVAAFNWLLLQLHITANIVIQLLHIALSRQARCNVTFEIFKGDDFSFSN